MGNIKKKRRRRAIRQKVIRVGLLLVIVLTVGYGIYEFAGEEMPPGKKSEWEAPDKENKPASVRKTIAFYAESHQIDISEYPEEIVEMLKKNKEAKDFVLHYPEKKNKEYDINLDREAKGDKVPLFIQWDERWGYEAYGSSIVGISGCGPVCLSMVAVYLKKDPTMNPKWMAKYSEENGYYTQGQGTAWSLMTEGAEALGLTAAEIPLDEQRMVSNLEVGNPIICSVRPGDFTTTGHYIVLTGYEDGQFRVNDPNSNIRSEQFWSYEQIRSQIKNLWVYQ